MTVFKAWSKCTGKVKFEAPFKTVKGLWNQDHVLTFVNDYRTRPCVEVAENHFKVI